MHVKRQNQERRFPLHVHISVLFSLLLLGSGVLIGLFNYYQTTQVILSSSSQLFNQFREEVEADLHHTYQPIRRLLSPIDLIPDVLPVIGIVDDLVLIPLVISWMVRLLPEALKRRPPSPSRTLARKA